MPNKEGGSDRRATMFHYFSIFKKDIYELSKFCLLVDPLFTQKEVS
jgi:hypothetical protein